MQCYYGVTSVMQCYYCISTRMSSVRTCCWSTRRRTLWQDRNYIRTPTHSNCYMGKDIVLQILFQIHIVAGFRGWTYFFMCGMIIINNIYPSCTLKHVLRTDWKIFHPWQYFSGGYINKKSVGDWFIRSYVIIALSEVCERLQNGCYCILQLPPGDN